MPTRTPGGRRHGLLHGAVGLVALCAIGLVALWNGQTNLDHAIEDRVTERAGVVERFSAAGSSIYDPERLIRDANAAGFVQEVEHPGNHELLEQFRVSAAAEAQHVVALLDGAGTVLASLPSDAPLRVEDLGDAFAGALDGDPRLSPVFDVDGTLVWARTIPVGGREPWGVLVLVDALEDGWLQRLYEDLGSLGRGPGGLTLLDQAGVAAASWNPALVGETVVAVDRLDSVGTATLTWTDDVDGVPMIHIATARTGTYADTTLIFHQDEAGFFGDLRSAQRQRDIAILAVLAMAVVALTGFTVTRLRSIRRAERRAEVVLAATDDIIAVLGPDATIQSITIGLERLLGHDHTAWPGRPFLELVAADQRHVVETILAGAREHGDSSVLGVALTHADGSQRWFDVVVRDQRRDRNVSGLVVTCSEVGARKSLEDLLAHEAAHDTLTGISNRGHFDAALAELLEARDALVVGVVDLDRFKSLNDRLGHDAGDEALVAVAEILQAHVGDHGIVGRMGGDEFAFAIGGVDDRQLDAMTKGIIGSIEQVWPGGSNGPNLSASVGTVRIGVAGAISETILREADRAMYLAKTAGGGRHVAADLDHSLLTADAPAEASPDRGSAGPGGPRTEPTGRDPHRAGRPHRVRRADLVGLAVVLAAMTVLGSMTLQLSARAQAGSERDRMADRVALLHSLNQSSATNTDPSRLMGLAAAVPWDPENPALTEYILGFWATAPAVGTNGMAALVDPSGEVLASSPPGASIPAAATTASGAWDHVLSGNPFVPPLVDDSAGTLRSYWVLPVGDAGSVSRIVVLGVAMAESDWSEVFVQIGSLGASDGGTVLVDSNGRAIASWDPSMIGEVAIDPALLDGLRTGDDRQIFETVDGSEHVTLAVRMPGDDWERYSLWQQDAADLFADLRAGQGARDAAMLGAAAVTIGGLALGNRHRVQLIRRQQGRLHTLLQESSTVVAIVDRNARFSFVSSGVSGHFGVQPRELVGHAVEDMLDDAGPELRAALAATAPGRGASLRGLTLHTADRKVRICDIEVGDLTTHPAVKGHLLTCRDRTDRQALEDHLRDQATHDPLTGLLNRSAFARRVEALHDDRREVVAGYAVVFIDLDRFKPVNDTYGHPFGDEVLRVLSRRLESVVRADDVVARHGGDEFTILLRNCDRQRAETTTERMLDAVREPIRIGDVEIQVGASAGVALSTRSDGQVGHVLRTADHAMYQAKEAGRNQWAMAAAATTGL